MRSFIAIALEAPARREIAAAEEALVAARGPVRWVRSDNLHLTVAFLGDIKEALVPIIDGRLAPLAGSTPARRLVMTEVGGFPRDRPRVLWLGLAAGHDWFVELTRAVRSALAEGLDLDLDQREPNAHVTLARVERPDRALVPALQAAFAGRAITSRADRLTLFSSELGRGGPVYTIEREWPFRGDAPADE